MSWTHHWVWLIAAAWRRRSWVPGAAVMVTAAVFSGQIPMPWPGPSSGLGNLLAGDLWVVYGLAVLAATAMAMRWEQRRSAEH